MLKKLSLLFFVSFFYADELNILQREFKNQQRVKELQSSTFKSDINLQDKPKKTQDKIALNERPCFEIDSVILNGKDNVKFQRYLADALNKVGFKSGDCLGEKSINSIVLAVSNEIISNGFITSFVGIKPLNLKSRKIELVLNLGKIDKISINNKDTQRHRAMLFSAFGGLNRNKTLNIREIEQALENVSNATIGDVSILLEPSNVINLTNILITRHTKALPVSLNFSLDNYGSKETGRYQSSVVASGVNIIGFNEIYTLSLGKAILNNEKTRLNDVSKSANSSNYYLNFTIPFGYFSLSYTNSDYAYSQIIPSTSQLYEYSRNSKNQSLGLSYLAYRDQSLKSTAFLNLFKRSSKNYIEGIELTNQTMAISGYELGLRSRLNLQTTRLEATLTYRHSTEQVWLLDLGYSRQISQRLTHNATLYMQYNKSTLAMQDKISIGGIYSVRGFDGQMSLSGQKGAYIRNNLEYKHTGNHTIYFVLDSGVVYDITNSNKLAGAGLGIKGHFKLANQILSYNLLAQTPIYKPDHFKTDRVSLNFKIGVSW